jgi:hypothetical protein
MIILIRNPIHCGNNLSLIDLIHNSVTTVDIIMTNNGNMIKLVK